MSSRVAANILGHELGIPSGTLFRVLWPDADSGAAIPLFYRIRVNRQVVQLSVLLEYL